MNLTVYVPKDLADRLERRARREGTTPSLFAQGVLRAALEPERRTFSRAFRELAGSWEDDRSASAIIRDIRGHRRSAGRDRLG
jgi:hypothetical protein